MKPTLEYLKEKFWEYNRDMFGGKLPDIPIEIVNVKTFLGLCSCKTRNGENGKNEYYDFKLLFNNRLEVDEQELQDVIIHEMIHYFILYNQLEDVSSHGPVFRSMMDVINTKFGRHITISHKTTASENEKLVDTQRRWHVVAAIEMNDGRFGIKVLPRIVQSVIKVVEELSKDANIASINLYMTDEPYFNKFPCSTTVKFRIVNPDEPRQHLINAAHLIIYDDDLIEG